VEDTGPSTVTSAANSDTLGRNAPTVETCNLLLIFSSKVLDLGLEQKVVNMKGDVGDNEDEDLNGKQEDLVRYELCGLQCGGR
jgi:hypothetical protein